MIKFNMNKTITALVGAAVLTLGLTSCQDPIFYDIRQEVHLEKATILGEVYSIIRHNADSKEYIYLSNGKIYRKENTPVQKYGDWREVGKPAGHVHTIASDGTNLYAISIFYDEDTSEGEMRVSSRKLYYSPDHGDTWEFIEELNRPSYSTSNNKNPNNYCYLSCTNTTDVGNRKAYLFQTDNGKITHYPLKNGAKETGEVSDALSCAVAGSTVQFFSGRAACSDAGNNTVYFSKGSSLYKTSSNEASGSLVCAAPRGEITGIAVMKYSVLVTTISGSALISTDPLSGKPVGEEMDFANLNSTLSNLYEGNTCLAAHPSEPAKDTPVYGSISVYGSGSNSALFNHEGLWAYYPARGKWNIE